MNRRVLGWALVFCAAILATRATFADNVTSPIARQLWSANADPADTGIVRLGNAEQVCWEASPASADVCLAVNSSEQATLNATVVLSPPDIDAGATVLSDAFHFLVPQTNHALGEFRLYGYDTLFNGTYDTAYTLGYNSTAGGGRTIATEPQLSWQMETDYNNGTNHSVEYYLQYQPDNTVAAVPNKRVFFMGWRRDSYAETFSPEWRASSFNFRRWDDAAECTGSVTPHPCCTGAGVGATCGSVWGGLSPTLFSLLGAVGQGTGTAINLTAQNSQDTYVQFSNTANKSLIVGSTNANGPYLTVGGTATNFSFNGAQTVTQQNGIYSVVDTDAGALDPRYSYSDTGTVANTTNDGHTRGTWYSKYTVTGGTKFGTFYGGYFLPTDAQTLANTHKGYRCYLGSVTGASTTSSCLDLDAQTGVGGTHTLGTMSNGTLSMTAAPFQWDTTPATTGNLRHPNNVDALCWRNAANSANLCLKADASNNLLYNGSGFSGDVTAVGAGCATGACFTDTVTTSGTEMLRWEGTTSDAYDLILSTVADPTAGSNYLAINGHLLLDDDTSPTDTAWITVRDLAAPADQAGSGTTGIPAMYLLGQAGGNTSAVTLQVGGTGGYISMESGTGGAATAGANGGDGGGVSMYTGYGGAVTNAQSGAAGGTGGAFSFTAQSGGALSGTGPGTAGIGGTFTVSAGQGGAATGAGNIGGAGGNLTFGPGAAGVGSAGATSGAAGYVRLNGQLSLFTLSPVSISSNQNNYALPVGSGARLTSNGAYDITGLTNAGGVNSASQLMELHNIGTFNLTLKDESVSSTAANRFALTEDYVLAPDTSVLLSYDAPSTRWRLVGPGSVTRGNITTLTNKTYTVTPAVSTSFIQSATANPASTGALRVSNAEDGLCWRNAANTADICESVNATDQLTVPAAALTTSYFVSGDITPAQLTATQNDYAPTGLATASVLRLTGDANRIITGLTGGVDGRLVTLINANDTIANTFTIQLSTESVSSTAANRFDFGTGVGTQSVILNVRESITLWYDSTSSRWRPFSNGLPKTGVIAGQYNDATIGVGGLLTIDSQGRITAVTDQLIALDNGIATTVHQASTNKVQIMRHATDCTAITDGLDGELCYEKDADTLYACEPTAGGCDTAAEWRATGAAGSGDITDVGDCAGVSGACFTSAAGAGTTLTFHNATSGTVALNTVIGALGTVTASLPAATGTIVLKDTVDILTNKTIPTAGLAFTNATSGTVTLGTVTGALGTVTASLPAATGTIVLKDTTDDLSNKSIVTAGLAFKNATSGTVTINTVTGALGTVTASLPAKTGTIAVGPLVKSLTWFFPGTPATGQQAPRALVPEGVTGCTITNSRISVGTAAGSGSPAYNIARCTTSAGNCTATSNIYTSAVGLTTNQSVAGGAPNTATVTAGDAFKVDITNVGVTIADITVTMAYTCDQ